MKLDSVVCRLKGEIDGTKYDLGPIKASEAEKVEGWTGYSLKDFEAKLWDGDVQAARAVRALMEFRSGTLSRFADVDIDDVDSIDFDPYDPQGRKVTLSRDDQGKPVIEKGLAVFLFDGERLDPQRAEEASPTG